MLAVSRMRSVALALVAMTSTASAGTYLGFGLGTAPATSTNTERMSTVADGRSGRGILGYRFGRLAAEGAVGRFGLFVNGPYEFDSTQLSVGGKYGLPIGDNFEVIGRGGLQRTFLTGMPDGWDLSGNGYYVAGGVEYRLNLGVTGASIFLDYQYSSATLSSDAIQDVAVTNRMWTMGATLSL